jgi:hypothetical protein
MTAMHCTTSGPPSPRLSTWLALALGVSLALSGAPALAQDDLPDEDPPEDGDDAPTAAAPAVSPNPDADAPPIEEGDAEGDAKGAAHDGPPGDEIDGEDAAEDPTEDTDEADGPDLDEIVPVRELPPPVRVDPVQIAYDLARQAYEREDWPISLNRARKVQVLKKDHVGAILIEAGSLHRMRHWEESMKAYHTLEDDPGAGERVRKMINLYDNRWRRDQPSLSMGLTLRDDHALEDKAWKAGFAAEIEAPIAGPVAVRVDIVSGWQTNGQLGMKGAQMAALLAWQQPIGLWAVDAAVGPAMWLGRSKYWEGAYTGPFPGYRAAIGGSVRPLRNLGFRAELGHAGFWGTKALLGGFSGGLDGRLMVTGYVR